LIKIIKDNNLINTKNGLIQKPVVINVRNFEESTIQIFQNKINIGKNTGQKIIPIIVNTYGGDVDNLIEMISIIENAQADGLIVATINRSVAFSAGAILVGFGTQKYRYADPASSFMMHEISSLTEGKVSDINNEAHFLRLFNDSIYKKLAKYCWHEDENYFLKLMKDKDIYLNPIEALSHRLIDYIGNPRMEVEIKVEYKWKV
jgi:ATP-dependent protease ClpP protease subunit